MVPCPSISETILGFTFMVRSSVAQVVEPSHWQLRSLEQRLETAAGQGPAVQGFSGLRGKYQAVLPPQGASPIYLLQLALEVASEGIQRALSELHAPSAALGLGGCKHRAALGGGQGSAYPKGPRLEIHVLPYQTQQLTLSQARVDR